MDPVADGVSAPLRDSEDTRTTTIEGLTTAEARERLAHDGPNSIPEKHPNQMLLLASKFWGPIPWLLEAAIVMELVLGNTAAAVVIAILVILDAGLAFNEEGGAQNALALLRQRLTVEARVLRDGTWSVLPAAGLVRGDVIHVRQGDLIPADVTLVDGTCSVDQSALTGESAAIKLAPGSQGYSGSIVVRGEASGTVTATGISTFFGRTAELVSTAHAPGHLERLIFGFVRDLLIVDAALVVMVLADGAARGMSWGSLLPFAVILVVAAVPIALPTTFTLASALGSKELARRGVLVTRLAAIEEAASVEVLCTDKTGTITENRLAVSDLHAYPPFDGSQLLAVAAAASDAATQDPLDIAVITAAGAGSDTTLGTRVSFVPFDPATKRCEARFDTPEGPVVVTKGAPQVIAALAGVDPDRIADDIDTLASTGARVLGVARGADPSSLTLMGLVGLADPPRADSAMLIAHLKSLGVRVAMVTGDSLATAKAIAAKVGLGDRACKSDVLRAATGNPAPDAATSEPAADAPGRNPDLPGNLAGNQPPHRDAAGSTGMEGLLCDVYAEVLPEDKLRLVEKLQNSGIAVAMTGDGVNDAPALRKAEVGVAVASATDVAKAAASMVLTDPGLDNLVAGIEVSRRIHERLLTYTLNKIVKTLQVSLFLSIGLLVTGKFVTTPVLVVLLLLANNFATMSLATDRVSTPPRPERWSVRALMIASLGLSVPLVLFSFGIWYAGSLGLGLGTGALQTLTFVWLVTSAQATIYSVRERRHFWSSRPSGWLAASSALDILVVAILAWRGWLMVAISPLALGIGVGSAVAFLLVADALKTFLFRIAQLQS
ncbi:MAG: HAD-IC family P-type ATPase [Acidimicrobiales bacterium]